MSEHGESSEIGEVSVRAGSGEVFEGPLGPMRYVMRNDSGDVVEEGWIIVPALSPHEWKKGEYKEPGSSWRGGMAATRNAAGRVKVYANRSAEIHRPQALAALCLYDQPFGFTREDVDRLLGLASSRVAQDNNRLARPLKDFHEVRAFAPWLDDIANRIAALLPPRNASETK